MREIREREECEREGRERGEKGGERMAGREINAGRKWRD